MNESNVCLLDAPEPAAPVRQTPGRVGVAVVGCGYWGPNLIRNFNANPTSEVVALCDQNAETLNRVGASAPPPARRATSRACSTDPAVEAVVIATPVGTHAALAAAAPAGRQARPRREADGDLRARGRGTGRARRGTTAGR